VIHAAVLHSCACSVILPIKDSCWRLGLTFSCLFLASVCSTTSGGSNAPASMCCNTSLMAFEQSPAGNSQYADTTTHAGRQTHTTLWQ
jgi:hypothetical protein